MGPDPNSLASVPHENAGEGSRARTCLGVTKLLLQSGGPRGPERSYVQLQKNKVNISCPLEYMARNILTQYSNKKLLQR